MNLARSIWSDLHLRLIRQFPDLVMSRSLQLLASGLLLALFEVTGALLMRISLVQVPSLDGAFSLMLLANAVLLSIWVAWPRHFSLLDRFGYRSKDLEYADLVILVLGASLMMGPPFLAERIMSSRVAAIRSSPQTMSDIGAIQRGLGYERLRETAFLLPSRLDPDESALYRVDTLPGVLTPLQAATRAFDNKQAGRTSVIASDVRELFETLRAYDPKRCAVSQVTKQEQIVSDIMHGAHSLSQTETADSDDGLGIPPLDRCLYEGTALISLNEILLAKGWGQRALAFRQTGIIAFAMSLMLAAVAVVYLLGTDISRITEFLLTRLAVLLGLAAALYGLNALIPGLLPSWGGLAVICGVAALYGLFDKSPDHSHAMRDGVLLAPVIGFIALALISVNEASVVLQGKNRPRDIFGFTLDSGNYLLGVAHLERPFVYLAISSLVYIVLVLHPVRDLRIKWRSRPK